MYELNVFCTAAHNASRDAHLKGIPYAAIREYYFATTERYSGWRLVYFFMTSLASFI